MNKVKSTNNFDPLTPFYDLLAKLFFGNTIQKAQTEYLHLIKANFKILILGGGTGWIISEFLNRQPTVGITYVEKSTQMIELAKKVSPNATIEFVNCAFEEWGSEEKFDFVLCNFFLDVFQRSKLEGQIIPNIKGLIAKNGGLLVADFQVNSSIWQKILLWIMHRFFGVFSNMESDRLNDLNRSLKSNGFNVANEKYFFKKMIFSRVYALNP